MDAIPNILDSAPIYIALCLKGTLKPMMFIAPENSAAAPIPATARPTMNIVESDAAAHSIDPSSKINNAEI